MFYAMLYSSIIIILDSELSPGRIRPLEVTGRFGEVTPRSRGSSSGPVSDTNESDTGRNLTADRRSSVPRIRVPYSPPDANGVT